MDGVDLDPDKIIPGCLKPYPDYKHYHLHMPQVKDGYAYLAYCGYGLIILDVHDVTRPKYVGSLKIDPPFSEIISRCEDVLVDDRGLIYMTDSNGGLSVFRCLV